MDGLREVANTFRNAARGAFFGMAVGSAAGYLATVLKITKTITFVNLGLSFAAGQGAYWFLDYAFKQVDAIQERGWLRDIVHNLVLPILCVLAGVYVGVTHASLFAYSITAFGLGALFLGIILQANYPEKKVLA